MVKRMLVKIFFTVFGQNNRKQLISHESNKEATQIKKQLMSHEFFLKECVKMSTLS